MSAIIKECIWDSDFFGLSIGKAIIHNDEDVQQIVLSGQPKQYDLIYLFSDNQISPFPGCSLTDIKRVYSKPIYPHIKCDEHIRLINGDSPNEELISLALKSGEHSRFRTDSHFPQGSYERLYRRWIENSFNGEMGQYVIGYYEENFLSGFLTISIHGEDASIGLLAVHENRRHLGIGTKILSFADSFLFDHGVKIIDVATQAYNTKACSLYEKNGYLIKSSTYIYHWWI